MRSSSLQAGSYLSKLVEGKYDGPDVTTFIHTLISVKQEELA